MKARVGHTGIVVRDLDSQIDFYTRVLGLVLESRFTREGPFIENVTGVEGAELDIAVLGAADRPASVELLRYRSHPDHSPVRAANAMYCSHVMFEVDDIAAALAEVRLAGGVPLSPPQLSPEGTKLVFYCRDPEGTLIEFIEYLDADPRYPQN